MSKGDLLKEIGGAEALYKLMDRFYKKMFKDKEMTKFVHRQSDPHAERLALFVLQKMTGGCEWSSTRPPGALHTAHSDSINCPRREMEKRGVYFTSQDCRTWMRLMFWSVKEEKLDVISPRFFSWYVNFIKVFISFYLHSAGRFVEDSIEWSEDEENVEKYLKDLTMKY